MSSYNYAEPQLLAAQQYTNCIRQEEVGRLEIQFFIVKVPILLSFITNAVVSLKFFFVCQYLKENLVEISFRFGI